VIPDEAYAAWDAKAAGAAAEGRLGQRFAAYKAAFPELAAEFKRRMAGELPANFAQHRGATQGGRAHQGRDRGQPQGQPDRAGAFTAALPELLGGSRRPDRLQPDQHQPARPALRFDDAGTPNGGRHINYGVREFGMAAIMNGVALHGGFIPYGGTFLTFSDYSRNAIRMAALMKRA
jgi:transketolase